MNSAAHNLKTIRLFHVEDEPLDADLLKVHLRGLEIPVSIVEIASDIDFRKAIRAGPPDLVLSDSNVRGFDTENVFHYARNTSPPIPYIMFSGHPDPLLREKALASGAYAFIDKGRPGELIAAIRRLFVTKSELLPPPEHPVLAQCKEFRCLACRTAAGRWVDYIHRRELPEVLSWAEV
ncbi:MAG TPA: response regulator [Verrucomicrobiae bacterium]|nr:response regulator [Verrucomicrobiae bacterium]